jgi:hypothetical protein
LGLGPPPPKPSEPFPLPTNDRFRLDKVQAFLPAAPELREPDPQNPISVSYFRFDLFLPDGPPVEAELMTQCDNLEKQPSLHNPKCERGEQRLENDDE